MGIVTGAQIPFYISMQCGAKAAAAKLGVSLRTAAPTQYSPSLQTPIVDSMFQSGIKGMVLVPTSATAFIPTVTHEKASGIPVVTADSDLARRNIALANYSSNNTQGGQLAAHEMSKLVPAGGTVLVVTFEPGEAVEDARAQGFVKGAHRTKLHVLPLQYGQDQATKISQLVQSSLLAHPEIKGIFATDEVTATAVAAGLTASHAQGKVKLIGYDADPAEVANLKRGVFNALVAQSPYKEGFGAVTTLVRHIRHPSAKHGPYSYLTPTVVLTRSSVRTAAGRAATYRTSC